MDFRIGPEGVDRDLVFEFFWRFSVFECALKRGGYFDTREGSRSALADWDRFGEEISGRFETVSLDGFQQAVTRLQRLAPKRQVVDGVELRWWRVPRREGESNEQYTLRLLKTARNNLFHGGKYLDGPVHEIERDRNILGAGITILKGCYELHDQVKRLIDQAA